GIRDFHVTGVQTCALPISACVLPSFSARANCPKRSSSLLKLGLRLFHSLRICTGQLGDLLNDTVDDARVLVQQLAVVLPAELRQNGRASGREKVEHTRGAV